LVDIDLSGMSRLTSIGNLFLSGKYSEHTDVCDDFEYLAKNMPKCGYIFVQSYMENMSSFCEDVECLKKSIIRHLALYANDMTWKYSVDALSITKTDLDTVKESVSFLTIDVRKRGRWVLDVKEPIE